MAARNPNPGRITPAIWRLWTQFDAVEPTVLLGGIFALKRGYHSSRTLNQRSWPGDYSIRLPLDKLGPSDKAGAIDLTMSAAAMKRYTARLDAAAKARDPRLYRGGRPVLREFIGTKDGRRVYCYDLVERRVYHNRDRTHLWHIHLSVTRKFAGDWAALAGVLSVMTDRAVTAPARKAPPRSTRERKPSGSWQKEIVSKMDIVDLSTVTKTSSTWVKGAAVRRLQALLLADGHGPKGLVGKDGRPDGSAGPATKAALGAAQKKHRTGKAGSPTTPDYVAGKATFAALLGTKV
jgi:hypothetical protein